MIKNVHANSAKAALLIDLNHSKTLFAKSPNAPLPIASLTKLMTFIILLGHLNSKKANWNDIVQVSSRSAKTKGSTSNLKVGDQISLKDLAKGLIIPSGNDSAVAIAEHLSGTEKNFVIEMNRKAKKIGLTNTHFINSHGLSNQNVSSVYDVSMMVKYLIETGEIFEFSTCKTETITRNLTEVCKIKNTNRLLNKGLGVTGLKTGRILGSGFNLVATATRGSARVLSIVIGTPNITLRDRETTQLLNYAFKKIKKRT